MRTLSWLCGSMAIAFVMAGSLLLLQPSTGHAGYLTSNCSQCNDECYINDGNPGGCENEYCPQSPSTLVYCSRAFFGKCQCSYNYTKNLCDTCS